ncbi:2704_t:CDS:1, partial [Funneliformis mosseae]
SLSSLEFAHIISSSEDISEFLSNEELSSDDKSSSNGKSSTIIGLFLKDTFIKYFFCFD